MPHGRQIDSFDDDLTTSGPNLKYGANLREFWPCLTKSFRPVVSGLSMPTRRGYTAWRICRECSRPDLLPISAIRRVTPTEIKATDEPSR
jgi:hypothetical protein